MEFHVPLTSTRPDLDAIAKALRAVDPSALVDIDPAGQALRIAATVELPALASLLEQAGYPVAAHAIGRVPSTCCGGCGG